MSEQTDPNVVPDSDMTSADLLTAEQFADARDELPEGGRWTELIAGRVVTLSPPESEHGTAVLNLSKSLAAFAQSVQNGYACFEIGLIVGRDPDTVRCPAVSYFASGPLFAESDNVITEVRPALVVELASSNDRRKDMADRVTSFLDWGVLLVWVLDPQARQAYVFEKHRRNQVLSEHQTLIGSSALGGFQCKVGDFFKEPPWWNKRPDRPARPNV